jgi:hypothetical protein
MGVTFKVIGVKRKFASELLAEAHIGTLMELQARFTIY